MSNAVTKAVDIDEVLGREIAVLLSRAYTDQRHLDSYTGAERAQWTASVVALEADDTAVMPTEWLGRFPTMRNVWRPRNERLRSAHFIEGDAGERLVGHVGLFEHEFRIGDSAPVRAAYVEDVGTLPSAGGKGVASGLMNRASEYAAGQGFEVMGLSTGSPTFYERLGWIRWTGTATYVTRSGREIPTGGTMVLGLTETVRALLARMQGTHLQHGLREGTQG